MFARSTVPSLIVIGTLQHRYGGPGRGRREREPGEREDDCSQPAAGAAACGSGGSRFAPAPAGARRALRDDPLTLLTRWVVVDAGPLPRPVSPP